MLEPEPEFVGRVAGSSNCIAALTVFGGLGAGVRVYWTILGISYVIEDGVVNDGKYEKMKKITTRVRIRYY